MWQVDKEVHTLPQGTQGMKKVKDLKEDFAFFTVDKKKVVLEIVEPVEVLPWGFQRWRFPGQLGLDNAPTV